jgi:hypothetical protein
LFYASTIHGKERNEKAAYDLLAASMR